MMHEVVCLVVVFLPDTQAQSYVGCYPRNPGARQFIANPGDYDPATITSEVCKLKCGKLGYTYAGLTQGMLCLCGNTLTTTAVTDTYCLQACFGNPAEFCGASLYYSVHTTPQLLTGFTISVPDIIETYAPSTINFNIQSGINVQYSGQVHGDDSPEIAPTTATTLQQYVRKEGVVVIAAKAEDSNGITLKSSVPVKVQTKIKGIKFTCPDQVIGLVQFSCFLHIAMGTSMNVNVDMQDGNVIHVRTPDTRSYTTGQESGLISPVAHPGSFLYLLPEHSVKTNGTLVALDYVSAVAGTAYIQVFRPSCGNSSFKFCYKSYSCINVNESCNIQPSGNHWKHNCGAGTIYSFGRRKCIDTSTNNIVPDTVRQDWNQMDFQMFDFVSEFMFTVSSVGRNFYQVPDADMLTVDPGDILAITEGTARFALLESTGENYEFYYDVNADPNWALRGTNGYRLQVTPSVLTARHSVKAFFVKPIHLKIRHIYDFLHEAYLNVLVTAENNVTVPALTATQLVEVQVVIANLTIAQILPVATNDTTTIIIPAHAGSKPVYTYTFGDGEVMVTNSSTVTHIYRTAGVYLITVTAENAISSMTATTEVIIQDSIKDLIAVPALNATIFGEPTVINWNISQGTNVTYTLMMGDTIKYVLEYPFMSELNCIASRIQTLLATAAIAEDTTVAPTIQCTTVSTVNMTNEIESENGTINGTNGLNTTIGVNVTCEEATTTPAVVQTTTTLPPLSCNGTSAELIGSISHMYGTPDWFEFELRADNLVSSQTFNFSIPVQIPITGFVINETEPIKFGTSRMVHMSVIDGTNIEHSLSLNDSVLLISHLSSVNKTGYGIIDTSNYVRNGKHTLVGTVKNLVTPLTTFFLEVWIDYPITNLVINIDHYFIPVGNIVTFEVEMYWCSRFNTLFNYTDGTEVEYYYSDLLEAPENFNKTHFFGYPGLFPVQISITNPVDFNLTTHDIYVQYAVKNVEVSVLTPVRIEFNNTFGRSITDLFFLGGVPMPTMATNNMDFSDGSTYAIPFEPVLNPSTTTTMTTTANSVNGSIDNTALNDTTTEATTTEATTTTTIATTAVAETITRDINTTTTENVETTSEYVTVAGDQPFQLTVYHNYMQAGTYNISVNVSNLVSYMFFFFVIDVDEPIIDLTLTPSIIYVPINTNSILNIMMNWGTRSTCVLHVGNGIDVYTQPCDRHSVVGIPHFFDTVGVFNPSVYANNTINSGSVYSSLGPIYVQVPVSGYSVICRDSCVNNIGPPYTPTYSFDMNFILLFSINVDKPTNASYIIDYGDGTVTMATDMPEDYFSYSWNNYRVFDFNHTYTRGNNYTVKVIIWNLVSNVTYEVKHDLFEVIKDLDFTVTEIDPVTGNYKAGGGPDQNYFALEHEIRFLASHTRGTHVTYTWVYGDDDIYSVYFDKESLHFYTDDFTFTVDLIATNKLSSRNISKTIHIQRGCWNISLSVDDPRSKNTSFDYQFDLGAIGTNACYYVDFVDKTSVPSQYLMFGDTTQCSQVPEWSHEWTNPNRNFFELDSAAWRISHENDTSKNITIRNMFMWQGVYPVRIQCKNKVSHTMYNYTTRVTKGPCWWPYVNLTRPNKCFSPMCDENNVKTHYRSNKLIIYSDVVINCTATNISIYTWSVFKVNENTGNETELSSSSLGNADLQSIGARLLIIESTYLEYGLYRFSLNVSMNELMGMYTIDTVYIRIIPTPLVVQISGGSMQKKKWGTPLSVDGITMTYDPDIDQSDKTGLTFIWLCRRLCESWPEFDADFNIIAPMEENCTYTPAFANDRGCSKVDNFDSSGKMINQTSGTLTVNTGEMYENDKIELKLIARKGDRQGEAVQILEIVEGEPPEIGLICVTNCGFKMNPDSRYTLKSKVEGWVKGTYFYYRWKLYGGKDWISLTEIPVDKWENNTSTGSEGPHMALDPILDDLLDVYKFSLYFFSVKIWRWGTSENLAGVTAQSFRTNEKPIPGLCSIFPKTGYGYETKYYIKAESFIDNDDGNLFTYKFGFWRSASDPITWFYEGRFSDNKGYEAPIPEGYEQENYRVNIVCRAYDLGGSFADAYTDFTNWPPNPIDVSQIIENATSSSGEINSLLVAADSKVGSVANCLAKFLNEEAEEMASTTIETTTMSMENTTYVNSTLSSDAVAAALARRIEIREFIIVGMLRIKTPNIEILQGMAAALGTLSRHHNELSLTAQESGAQILISYCECFKTETQISANDREEAALTVVEFIGNTLHACGYAAEQSERDANALYEEYYSSTLGDSDATTTTTTQATVQTTLTPEQYKAKQDEILAAKDRAKRACTAIQNAMDACIDVISKYKVAGERAAVLPTPKANLTSVKGLTQDLNKNLMQVLGSAEAAEKNTASGILLVKSQSVLGAPGHEITMEAEMLMNRFPYNYHTWTNSTEKASTKITSDVVTLKFRDSNNQEVPVKNNAQEFDIFVDRTNYDTTLTSVCNATTDWGEKMVIHTVRIEPGNSLNIALNPISQMSEIKNHLKNMNTWNGTDSELRANMFEVGEVDLYVFVGLGETVPTEEVYNFTCHLPLSDKKLDAMMSYLDSLSYENDTSQPRSVYLNERPDRYTCFFSNDQLNLEKSTNAHIGIKHRVLDGNRTTVTESSLTSTTPLPTTTTTAASGKRRKKRYTSKSEKAMDVAYDKMSDAKEDLDDALESLETVKQALLSSNTADAEKEALEALKAANEAQKNADAALAKAQESLVEAGNSNYHQSFAAEAAQYATVAQQYADAAKEIATQAYILVGWITTTTPLPTTTTTTMTPPTTTTTTTTTTTAATTTTTTTALETTMDINTTTTTTTTLAPTTTLPYYGYLSVLYCMEVYSVYCVFWNQTQNAWRSDGCRVGPLSRPERVHCLCDHLTSFGAGVTVPMNTINLDDSAFNKLDENPVIFATMCSALCLYLLVLIWARKRDLLDKVMAGFSPLPDNDPRDKYLYELTVFTGARKNAGTTAKVSFVLTGDKGETPPRYLADEKRPVLQRANVDGFVMAVPKPLGTLTHLRIWHDNMGSSPGWYFSRMQVHDIQTGDRYYFVGENWLSLDDDDGLIDRVIPIAGRAELTNFSYLFWNKTKHSLTDGHIWFSVFQRPVRSSFTRVQRATCCLSLLFCSMLANIAWYQSDDGASPNEYKLGPVKFTLQGLYVGLMASLMAFPINIIIVCLFRYAKPPPERKKSKIDAIKESDNKNEIKTETEGSEKPVDEKAGEKNDCQIQEPTLVKEKSVLDADFVEVELKKQKDFLDTGDDEQRLMTSTPSMIHENSQGKPIEIPLKSEKEKEKKPFRLPFWSIYVAYVLSFCSVAVSFWATIEFGGVFGLEKSIEWLISFFVSCIESIFFSQPIKVIIIAIFYALVIKKPDSSGEENEDNNLRDKEEWLHEHLSEKDLSDPEKLKMLETMKSSAPLPPELDFVKTAREERAKELAMYSMLKEIALCMVFLYLCLMIGYSNRDPWSYHLFTTYDKIFNKAQFAGDNYSIEFEQIESYDHFWNWTENALVQGLYNKDWYNGDIQEDRVIQDLNSISLGGARLRQLRVTSDRCLHPVNYFADECIEEYGIFKEDKDTYLPGWIKNETGGSGHPSFTYQSGSKLDGYPYWGKMATYSGGGYVADLGTDMASAVELIDILKQNRWIDKYTKAVFIEINLFNPNHNLWGISMYLLEFLQTGGIEPFARWHIFKLDRYIGPFMYFVMAIELVTIMFVIFYTVKEVRKFRSMGKQYFKEFWNVWEMTALLVAYVLVLVFIYRAVLSVQIMNRIHSKPDEFVNMYFTILWDEMSGYFIGILVFMETLRFLRLLRFNKKISLMGSTLLYVGKPILSFGFVFSIAFMSFAATAYMFFMSLLYDFRTYITTLETLMSMMLGKFDYTAAMTTTKVTGPLLFGFFCFCFNFILINFFLTILIDGFEAVRSDLDKQSNEHEVIEFMMKKLKHLIGFGKPPQRKRPGYLNDPRKNAYIYIEGKTPDEEKIAELDNKVVNMIEKMNTFMDVTSPDEEEGINEEMEKIKNKKKRKIVIS